MTSKLYITYKDLNELFAREEHIINLLLEKLEMYGNVDYLSDTSIEVGEDKFNLVLTLEKYQDD